MEETAFFQDLITQCTQLNYGTRDIFIICNDILQGHLPKTYFTDMGNFAFRKDLAAKLGLLNVDDWIGLTLNELQQRARTVGLEGYRTQPVQGTDPLNSATAVQQLGKASSSANHVPLHPTVDQQEIEETRRALELSMIQPEGPGAGR